MGFVMEAILKIVSVVMGGQLKEVVINDLVDGTFYAKLMVDQNGHEIEIDSRPSDAIALGVADDVPIYVAEEVLNQTQNDGEIDLNDGDDLDLDWD